MDNECCAKCRYYHRLKHNFKVGVGFEESYCCDVLMQLPEKDARAWVQEVKPQERCEMYEAIDELDKIKGYIDRIRNTGMGKEKSLEYIEKFVDGLKAERGINNED